MTAPHAPDRHVRAVASMRVVTRAAVAWSSALAVIGGAVFAGVVAAGAPLPPLLPTLGLAAVLALCIGRVALYPGELAASAELAVLLCAVVAFRHDAPLTGPLLLALLVGPLDRDHWRQRSFVRMAYNSGDRALAALGAVGAFAATTAALGSSTAVMVAATAVAAIAATALDSAATVALVVCLGGKVRSARRELLDIDALALPLAVLGGAVGFLATGVGWWAAALPLLALALVPELLQARARIPARAVRSALLTTELVATLAVVAWLAPPPSIPIVVVLAVLAVLVGIELVVDDRAPIAPVLGVAVAVVAFAAGGPAGAFTGALVAGGATVVGWCARRHASRRAMVATAFAVAVGALVGRIVVIDVDDRSVSCLLVIAGVALFAAPAVLAGREPRRRAALAVGWAAPLGVAPVAVVLVAGLAPTATMAVVAVVLVAGSVVGAGCGATPWRSRWCSLGMGQARARWRGPTFLALNATAVVTAIVDAAADAGDMRSSAAALTVALGSTAAVMALWATRQWRLAPRARTRQTAVLAGALVGWTAVAVLADHGHFVSVTLTALVLVAVVVVAGIATVRVGDRAH